MDEAKAWVDIPLPVDDDIPLPVDDDIPLPVDDDIPLPVDDDIPFLTTRGWGIRYEPRPTEAAEEGTTTGGA